MWAFDVETLRFLEVNDAAVLSYGYSRAEFLSMTVLDIRSPEDVPRLKQAIAATSPEAQGKGELVASPEDGTRFPVEVVSKEPSRWPAGGFDSGGRRECQIQRETRREEERRLASLVAETSAPSARWIHRRIAFKPAPRFCSGISTRHWCASGRSITPKPFWNCRRAREYIRN